MSTQLSSTLRPLHTAQEFFDLNYITAQQIAERMGVSRSSVSYAMRRGILPAPIVVPMGKENEIYLWERSTVEPIMEKWAFAVQVRKGELAP